MKIEVNTNMAIKDLKKQFHDFFEFLKIEFFSKKHGYEESSNKKNIYEANTPLKAISSQIKDLTIEFDDHTTVQAFEKKFYDVLGLNVQVFRKSGQVYIETSLTDAWTLGHQNSEGKLLSELDVIEPTNALDRDIWE